MTTTWPEPIEDPANATHTIAACDAPRDLLAEQPQTGRGDTGDAAKAAHMVCGQHPLSAHPHPRRTR